MSTLRQRTQSAFYDEYRELARQRGVAPSVVERCIQDMMAQARSILAGRCPQCRAPIVRYVDYERQQGQKAMPGAWVMYRCSTQPPPGQLRPAGVCDFMVDYVEGEAAS